MNSIKIGGPGYDIKLHPATRIQYLRVVAAVKVLSMIQIDIFQNDSLSVFTPLLLMVFCKSLCDSKSPLAFWTLLNILADLSNATQCLDGLGSFSNF